MKKFITVMILTLLALTISAQTRKEVCQWMKKGEWRNDFNKAKPHKTLNIEEFYTQYQKNTKQWNTLFKWLQETNLETIPKGKQPISNSSLVASVEDSQNEPLEKRNTESHKKKIDFMVVVKGIEGFALLDHSSSSISQPYNDKKDVMRYKYANQRGRR